MFKRLLAILLVPLAVLGSVNVFAAAGTRPYSPGIWEYTQELSDPAELTNASAVSGSLKIEAGGLAVYDFTLPFDAARLTIAYSASDDTEIAIRTEKGVYDAVLLSDESTKEIELSNERMGEFTISFTASAPVQITKLLYTKTEAGGENSVSNLTVLEYDDPYEEAMRSLVVIPLNSNTIKVKNALCRVDMENPLTVTITADGKLYAPFEAFAHAFGMYFENYPELNYAYMSGETYAWYFKGGEHWCEQNGRRISFKSSPLYMNGILYVPVREIAESMLKTVTYKDGFAIIGMRADVRNAAKNESIMVSLANEMSPFIITKTVSLGNTYHVSKNGSDSNSGTASAPFATIQKAADRAYAGDTVIIHEGVYREKVTFPHDGTAVSPIVFKAADGEDVTVSAFEEISGGFTSYTNPANNIAMYKRDVSALDFEMTADGTEWTDDRNFILYKGRTLLTGRHPNSDTSQESTQSRFNYKKLVKTTDEDGNEVYEDGSGYEDVTFIKAHGLNPLYPDKDTNEILPTRGDMRFRNIIQKKAIGTYYHEATSEIDLNQTTPDYWKGAAVIAQTGMAWTLSVGKVDSSEYGKITVKEDWNGQFGFTYYESKYESDYAWLTHHINTVDKPGEWYIDSAEKVLYIIPPQDTAVNDMVLEVKARQQVMDLTGRKYIQIENVNTQGGGLTMNRAECCILNGGRHKYISQADYSTWPSPENGDIYGTAPDDAPEYGELGFYIGGKNNAVINTDIEYSAGAGILVTGRYNYIYNNKIDKTGYGCTYLNGIHIKAKEEDDMTGGHAIYSNTSEGAYRSAFSIGCGTFKDKNGDSMTRVSIPLDIAYNEWAWSTLASRDTGIQYICYIVGGDDREYSKYHHNVAHDSAGSRVDSILHANTYFDGGSAGFDCYSNISYSSSDDYYYRARQYYYWNNSLGDFINTGLGSAWSNWSDDYAHPNGLEYNTTVYPDGMAFKAGAVQEGDGRFMDNYNNVQRSTAVMLADAELSGNAYADSKSYAVLPDTESMVSGDITLGDEGTVVTVCYSEDMYGKTLESLPNLTLKLYKNNKAVWEKTNVAAGVGRYMDSAASIKFYVPPDITGDVRFELSSDKSSVRLRKLFAVPFDYCTESAKRPFPYDGITPIVFGSADRWVQDEGNSDPVLGSSMTSEALDNFTYSFYGNTWTTEFYFDKREFTSDVNKVVFVGASNYSSSNVKLYLTMTNTETKKVYRNIAVIDCFGHFREGDSWHTEYMEADLTKTLPAGTYNITADFGKGGCTTAYSLIFFSE